MIRDCFWLSEGQFARLRPLLPDDTWGNARVDDRRVISGIVHVLKSGRALGRRPACLWAAQDTQ
jgi:transposase